MPSHYAHRRFGKDLIGILPASERQCVSRFRRLYDMGLYGPDIFFYYLPLWKTGRGNLGKKFHQMTGADFFPAACAAARSEAARAYLCGLLAHYCLDSICHPYINSLVQIEEARHIAFEAEFERFLMAKDGIPAPHTYDMSKKIHLTRGECLTVAEFYSGATAGIVRSSVRFMAFALRFFSGPNREVRQKLLNAVKPSYCDFFLPLEEVEDLSLYTGELSALYAQALDKYPVLLSQLMAHIRTGEALGEDFAHTFA